MHQCLQVPELVTMIFEWASLRSTGNGPATLACLARTCQSFRPIALDLLWHTHTTLWPLIKLFPEDIVTELVCETTGAILVGLARPPQGDEWSRFLSYASRIKGVRYSYPASFSLHSKRVHPSTFRMLLRHRPTELLFPGIRQLEWRLRSSEPDNSVAELLLLISPKLSDLSLRILEDTDETLVAQLEVALKEFSGKCNSLETFTFLCPCVPRLSAIAADIILRHNCLRTVYTMQPHDAPLSHEAIVHLAQMPTLRRLSLRSDIQQGSSLASLLTTCEVIFPALQDLIIYASTLASCTSLFDLIQSDQLGSVHVVALHPPTAAELKDFGTRLSTHRCQTTISTLSLSAGSSSPHGDPAYTVTDDTLRPLLALNNLTELTLELHCPTIIDNDFLQDMARAWPKLGLLEIGTKLKRNIGTPRVTLKGLIPLIHKCPGLHKLGIAFDTNVDELRGAYKEERRPTDGICNLFIRLLDVGGSILGDRDETDNAILAGFLSDLFPYICRISSAWALRANPLDPGEDEDDEDEAKEWDLVSRMTCEMARLRRQERLWLASRHKKPAAVEVLSKDD